MKNNNIGWERVSKERKKERNESLRLYNTFKPYQEKEERGDEKELR